MKNKIPKGYAYTSRYSWTKEKAEERAKKARKAGFIVKVIPAISRGGKKGHVLIAKPTKKGYGWLRRK